MKRRKKNAPGFSRGAQTNNHNGGASVQPVRPSAQVVPIGRPPMLDSWVLAAAACLRSARELVEEED